MELELKSGLQDLGHGLSYYQIDLHMIKVKAARKASCRRRRLLFGAVGDAVDGLHSVLWIHSP